ncbi:13919_t:CDS:2, partial [Acaulospora morrowiae]
LVFEQCIVCGERSHYTGERQFDQEGQKQRMECCVGVKSDEKGLLRTRLKSQVRESECDDNDTVETKKKPIKEGSERRHELAKAVLEEQDVAVIKESPTTCDENCEKIDGKEDIVLKK